MFRIGVRRFTTRAWRASYEGIVSESSRQKLREVSKAQGIASQGLVDGESSANYS